MCFFLCVLRVKLWNKNGFQTTPTTCLHSIYEKKDSHRKRDTLGKSLPAHAHIVFSCTLPK
jgi:hypothetical protein